MGFFKKIGAGLGEALGGGAGLFTAIGQAAVNKVKGKSNDEIMSDFDKTVKKGEELGEKTGKALAEPLAAIVVAAAAGQALKKSKNNIITEGPTGGGSGGNKYKAPAPQEPKEETPWNYPHNKP